jgi:LmbE family N-acetylglucosaminyl deacetylase
MRVCIVAAHPDDETIGASAVMGCQHDVTVIHVTTGAPADPRWWPPGISDARSYANLRADEAERAMAIGGANRIALEFHDQGVTHCAASLIETLRAQLERLRPEVIVTHAYEGGHPDHDAVAFAVAEVRHGASPYVPLLEMALYHGESGTLRIGEFIAGDTGLQCMLDREQLVRRRAMLAAYRSQQAVLDAFRDVTRESYRPAPRYDFTRPPHGGPLLYEQRGMASGASWRRLVARARGPAA